MIFDCTEEFKSNTHNCYLISIWISHGGAKKADFFLKIINRQIDCLFCGVCLIGFKKNKWDDVVASVIFHSYLYKLYERVLLLLLFKNVTILCMCIVYGREQTCMPSKHNYETKWEYEMYIQYMYL